MRKLRSLLLLLALALLTCGAAGGEAALSIGDPGVIRPGKAVLISFTAGDGDVDIVLEDGNGRELSVVVAGQSAQAGENRVWWNGTYNAIPVPEGPARMVLRQGDATAETPVTVGPVAPYLAQAALANDLITAEEGLELSVYASEDGTVSLARAEGEAWITMAQWDAQAGVNTFRCGTEGVPAGETLLALYLVDEAEDISDPLVLSAVFAEDASEEHATGSDAEEDAAAGEEGEEGKESEEGEEAESEAPEANEADETDETDEKTAEGDHELISYASSETVDLIEEVELLDDDTVFNDQRQYTPNWTSPYYGMDTTMNYWTLPMDITDEAAIWAMLMQPITVVDSGSKNAQRAQVTIRREPDEKSDGVGVVTCVSQGVHVLERGDTWTKIECYSSSFHDSKVKAWNMLVQGWIPTKYLKTVNPDPSMGMVVDKLTQRLYIFRDGHLFSTLLVSTGLANAMQPYNETRSGEFLIVSAVGEFKSDNIYCSLALRYNSGDLLHEVPHTKLADGGKDYRRQEAKLGTKASHGCIRVQRKQDPSGVNMRWLWDNRKMNTKIVIWEDWQGRQIPTPSDDTLLYYNPKKGQSYHSQPTCNSAKNIELQPFTYGELDTEPYSKLTRCEYCTPVLRKAEIAEINAVYVPGGDHDPVMTKARQKFLNQ